MAEPIRILIVDPHALVRECLATLLNRRRGFEVVATVGTGADALNAARTHAVDVAVVDPGVPEGGGPLVAALAGDAGAVLVLASDLRSAPSRLLRAGARGFLVKNCDLAELCRAIESVHRGELFVDSAASSTVLKELQPRTQSTESVDSLTPRELEVLELIALGFTNAEIARELCISEHTTKGHLAKILGKLQVGNRVQLATYAVQHGVVDPPEPVAAQEQSAR